MNKRRSFEFCTMLMVALCLAGTAAAADVEYAGSFSAELVADVESTQKTAFKYLSPERLKGEKTFAADAHVTSGKLYDPELDELYIQSVLVEEKNKLPVIFIDLNRDKSFSDNEKFTMKKSPRYREVYELKVNIPIKSNSYTSFPTFIQFLKRYQIQGMTENDRLIDQSDQAFAQGTVDVKGKKVLVQYAYDFLNKQVDPAAGELGIDANGDGEVDMDTVSPESAKARGETPVFRLGTLYVSTKKADVQKNSIVLSEREAKDYKRIELQVGNVVPDFEFTDFAGKKRKFSEFRGKFVLLDIWGFWCPACREELPFLKEAYATFQSRNFEIVGLNTDEQSNSAVQKSIEQNGMKWTHATRESVLTLLSEKLMVRSYPTTMLISPEGRILSLGRTEKGEPELRGADLLETLDGLLP